MPEMIASHCLARRLGRAKPARQYTLTLFEPIPIGDGTE